MIYEFTKYLFHIKLLIMSYQTSYGNYFDEDERDTSSISPSGFNPKMIENYFSKTITKNKIENNLNLGLKSLVDDMTKPVYESILKIINNDDVNNDDNHVEKYQSDEDNFSEYCLSEFDILDEEDIDEEDIDDQEYNYQEDDEHQNVILKNPNH